MESECKSVRISADKIDSEAFLVSVPLSEASEALPSPSGSDGVDGDDPGPPLPEETYTDTAPDATGIKWYISVGGTVLGLFGLTWASLGTYLLTAFTSFGAFVQANPIFAAVVVGSIILSATIFVCLLLMLAASAFLLSKYLKQKTWMLSLELGARKDTKNLNIEPGETFSWRKALW